VPELYGQAPSAQVFSTRTDVDGRTLVQFGGPQYGALLQTGATVTATYRIGTGVAGQVAADALTNLLDRLPGLDGVTNPLPAEGGADPETSATIRNNAPRSVRTFDRAVSLLDFQDLITASGEVAKALAAWVWDGFAPAVHLTVAGQQGTIFADLTSLGATLANARDPNQRLLLENFVQVPIFVTASLWTDPKRARSDVLAAASLALATALSFDALALGQSIHLSAIYAVLQGVPGVVAADVTGLGLRIPPGTVDPNAYLDSRGVTRNPDGSVAAVQDFLRIFAARPNPDRPGSVLPAELAAIASPAVDISITAQG
jgi:predicted phage baseplate assembly protein